MPRYYEEAAHLLLLILGRGLVLSPGADHRLILRGLALRLEEILSERPSHADAAIALLDALTANGEASIESPHRTRLVALAGTAIGNLMTRMHARP